MTTWFEGASWGMRVASGLSCLVVLMVLLGSAVAAIKVRGQLWSMYGRAAVMIATYGLLSAVFTIYWVQGDVSFWVPVLASWWLLVALVISARRSADISVAETSSGELRRDAVLLPSLVVYILIISFFASIRPNLAPNCVSRVAQTVTQTTAPNDLIINPGIDMELSASLVYFSQRSIITIFDWMVRGNILPPRNPWEVPNPVLVTPPARPDAADVLESIDKIARETRSNGGRVFSIGAYPDRQRPWSHFTQVTGFTLKNYAQFAGRPVWTMCGVEMVEVN